QHDERLWQLSDGNPLIVRALLQELCVAQGERPSATELARRFEQAGVVGEVLHRRLSLLPAGGREVLVAAAVAGDHADARTLEEVLGRPGRRGLATGVEAGVVEAPPDGPVAFVHPTLAESVLAAAADLRELHLRVATTLQRRGDGSDAVVVLRHLVAA